MNIMSLWFFIQIRWIQTKELSPCCQDTGRAVALINIFISAYADITLISSANSGFDCGGSV